MIKVTAIETMNEEQICDLLDKLAKEEEENAAPVERHREAEFNFMEGGEVNEEDLEDEADPLEEGNTDGLARMGCHVANLRSASQLRPEPPMPPEDPQQLTLIGEQEPTASGEQEPTPTDSSSSAAPPAIASTSTGVRSARSEPVTYTYLSSDEDLDVDEEPTGIYMRAANMCNTRREAMEEHQDGDGGNQLCDGVVMKPAKDLPPIAKRQKIVWKDSEVETPIQDLPFKPRKVGVCADVDEDNFDEYAALMLFLDDNIWRTMALETNRYYASKVGEGGKRVHDVSPAEVRAYIGIMFLFGLNPPAAISIPWERSSTFKNDIISSSMSFRRFKHIHNFFHLVDNETLPPADTIEYKTARVAPLLKPFKEKCRTVYKAVTKQLSIDEGSLGWKGNSAMRVYNPNKPHKYHIKSYKLVETASGYLSAIIFHDTTKHTVSQIVLTLLHNSPYHQNEGYSVFTDRFYSSPDLFWHLRTKMGFNATGTCISNRNQYPNKMLIEMIGKKPAKGSVASVRATKGTASLIAMKWVDAKEVNMLSTEATAKKIGCTSQKRRIQVTKPEMVPLYNKHMGGVDMNDYLESKYTPCRASKKLWRKLAMHILSLAVTNAYIIHSKVKKLDEMAKRHSQHYKFIEKLGNTMLMMSDTRPGRRCSATTPLQPAKNIGLHLPACYPPRKSERKKSNEHPDFTGKMKRESHRCQMAGCSKRTVFYCESCNVALCVKVDSNCFSAYHKKLPYVGEKQPPAASDSSQTSSAEEETPAETPRRVTHSRAAKRSRCSEETPPHPEKRVRKSPRAP